MYHLPQSFYDAVIEEYVERRNVMLAGLAKIEGVVVPKVNGAFYAMVRLPIDNSERFCQWMLEEFSFQGATVMMAPGSGFYSSAGAGDDEVRIAYVLNQADLANAITCLEQGLIAYNNR